MKTSYYYSPTSVFKTNKHNGFIHAMLLISESLMYSVDKSWANLLLEDIDKWSNEKIYEKFKVVFKTDTRIGVVLDKYDAIARDVKIINTVKHKTKDMLARIVHQKTIINCFKKELLIHRDVLIEHNSIRELMPFIDEGIWLLTLIDFENKANREDVLISEISDTLTRRESILALDKCVEEMFHYAMFNTAENAACDFIKMPLWNFPLLEELNYAQLKFTREDLQLALAQFSSELTDLSESLFQLPFTLDNQTQIKHLCESKLWQLIHQIQQTIDNSIYISQIKNKLGTETGLKICLGIASAETLIGYFKLTETILPYVADEIKQRTSRHIDLKASYVFIYFELYKGGHQAE